MPILPTMFLRAATLAVGITTGRTYRTVPLANSSPPQLGSAVKKSYLQISRQRSIELPNARSAWRVRAWSRGGVPVAPVWVFGPLVCLKVGCGVDWVVVHCHSGRGGDRVNE